MSKRPPTKSVSKHGGDASKKVKTGGADIPSSNFASVKPKPVPKHSHITQAQITSLPNLRQNIKDPTKAIRNLGLPEDVSSAMGPDVAQLLRYDKEKKKKEEIKARAEKSKPPQEKKVVKAVEEEEYKPKMVTQDESGRMIDEEGNVIHQKPSNKSLLIVNKNKDRDEKVKKILSLQRGTNRNSKFYDPTLVSKSQSLRNRRLNNAFHFIDKGSIIKKGEALRGHADASIASTDDGTKMNTENDTMAKLEQKLASSEIQIGIKRTGVRVKRHDPIPDVEWWDAPLLVPTRRSYLPEEYLVLEKESILKEKYDGEKKMEEAQNNSEQKAEGDPNQASLIERLNRNLELLMGDYSLDNALAKDKINNLVEHPSTFKIDGANQNVIIPTYLTKDERKKLRRKKRLEKEKDKQEKIKLGLMKPPPPKVKYSNFMSIMKDEAVADPTKVEKEVREAIEARLKAHLERNAKKKLTKEQKADKYMRKLKRDSAQECRVAVFRIEDLSHGAHKFKVNMNAQQLALNGVCIIVDKRLGLNLPNVVVVEGGPKAIKFYKKLMLRRVKWNLRAPREGAPAEADGEQAGKHDGFENKCTLVWEGISKDHSFNRWKVAEVKSEMEGRRLLSDRGVEFYWDRALTGAEVVDEQD